ncbi:MAG: hypothetical protein LBN33_11085 [Desulfovibrio sp.]|nr:hypothetical protein [Desulfovibrio sp.]
MFSILIENPVIRFAGSGFAEQNPFGGRSRGQIFPENAKADGPRDYFTRTGESELFALGDPATRQESAYAAAGRNARRAAGGGAEGRGPERAFMGALAQSGLDPEKAPSARGARGSAAKTEADETEANEDSLTETKSMGNQAVSKKDDDEEKSGNPQNLSEEDKRQVEELKSRDREVRAHEQAHAAAGAGFAGRPSYEMQTGPDGRRYAVGGEVPIDVSPASTPEATIAKARKIRAAALAPAEPSGPDRAIAAKAASMEAEARQEKISGKDEEENPGGNAAASEPGGIREAVRSATAKDDSLTAPETDGDDSKEYGKIARAAQAYARVSGALAPVKLEYGRGLSLAV